MESEKKKFKDTRLGAFLKKKAPIIMSKVGDALPDSGLLGIVKNLIDDSTELSPADKSLAHQQLKEMYELEIKDRDSARNREIEVSKNGKIDWLFNLTGLIGLLVFCFIVYAITYLEIPEKNKDVFIHLIGISEGVVLSIFGYYFGSAVKKNIQ